MNRQFFDDLGNFVAIPRARFIEEHKNLLKVLEKKNPQELEAERVDQKKELEAEIKKQKQKKKSKKVSVKDGSE